MACIFFIPWPFPSHGTASLQLARTLRAAGHEVVYINIGKDDPRYAAHGFCSLVILQDVLPDGLLGVFQRYSGLRQVRELRRGLPLLIASLDRELERLSGEYRPSLAVIDRALPYVALLFHRVGIPSQLLNTVLPLDRDPDVPPLTSALPPPETKVERWRSRLHWWVLFGREEVRTRVLGLHQIYKGLAVTCGFPIDKMRSAGVGGYHPQVTELITCPDCFDLPRAPSQRRLYVGPCIDLERLEPAFDWRRLDSSRPLAYCALGTRAAIYAGALGFLARLAEAFDRLPEWQAVIAAGELYAPLTERLKERCSPNVIVVAEAPQLSMLQRARLMVTHGGLGSIKEALFFGVPLAVFPARGDQFGNSTRVAYHGLGVVGSFRRSTPAQMSGIVRTAGESQAIRARVEAMRAQFVDAEQGPRNLEVLEQIMAAGVS